MREPHTPPSPEVQAEQEAQQNVDYFWSQVTDAETLSHCSGWDKLHMAEASLWLRLDTLDIKASPEIRAKYRYEEFTNWIPKSASEAYTATHFGFARKSFSAIEGFWSDARDEMDTLRKGIRGDEVDSKLIRANRQILYALGDNLMAKESWIKGEWPRKNSEAYKNRQKYWRGQMLALADSKLPMVNGDPAGEEVLLKLFAKVLSESVARDSYWTIEFEMMPSAAGRIATETALGEQEPKPEDTTKGEDRYIDIMPDEEQRHLKSRRRDYAQVWEQLNHAGMPQAEKMAILWRRFPEFKPAEIAYAEELRDIAIRVARAKSEGGGSKRRSPTRYVGHRDTGPPPHIAEDVRRDQGLID